MIFLEWDEDKRASNLNKHGIDFEDLTDFWEGEVYTKLDGRFDYGEIRFLSLGSFAGIVVAVSHTESDSIIRMISARKATKNEQKEYFENIRQ